MPICYMRALRTGQVLGLWALAEPFDFFLSGMPANYHKDESASAYALGGQALPARKRAFYASRYLLWHLARQSGVTVLGLYKKKDRIPRLLGKGAPYVSLSHTTDYVAAALHPHSPIGIDIERISSTPMRVLARFLQPKEQSIARQSNACATLYWSAKETAYKALRQPKLSLQKDLFIRCHNPSGLLAIQHPLAADPLWVRYVFYKQSVLTYSLPER